jgi:hypothetical protein
VSQPSGQRLILDHTALAAGLGLDSPPTARQALSQLLHAAVEGGPRLIVPALCLAAAASERAGLAEHLAALLAQAPPGAIEVRGLLRDARLDAAQVLLPERPWPVLHAVHCCLTGSPVVTADPGAYLGSGVDTLSLWR